MPKVPDDATQISAWLAGIDENQADATLYRSMSMRARPAAANTLPTFTLRLLPADGWVVAALLLAGLWLLAHPYQGDIFGDAQLYVAQALSHIYPDIFRGDIFFAYGSQDDYTLFSRIYAWLISRLGLNGASLTVVVLSQALWIYAAWRIASLVSMPQRLVFLALLIALPAFYATNVFSYGEAQATARIVAEALTLAGIAAALAQRPYLAGLLLLVAITQHPLMAFGGIVLLGLWRGLAAPRRAATAALILALAASMVVASIGLGERLIRQMDQPWLELVRSRSDFIFMSSWHLQDWNQLMLSLCLLAAGWQLKKGTTLGRLFLAGLGLGIGTLILVWVGVEWWHSQLLIQAQPVRAFWLVKWLALLAFASLLEPREKSDCWPPILFATGWFAQNSIGGILALAGTALTGKKGRTLALPGLAWSLPWVGAAVWAATELLGYYYEIPVPIGGWHSSQGHSHPSLEGATTLFALSDTPIILAAMTAWGLNFVWSPKHEGQSPLLRSWLFPLFAVAIFSTGVVTSVRLTKPTPFFADSPPSELPLAFATRIPQDATVYWQDHFALTWFALGRRSYYSKSQSAGSVFSREASMEMKRRADSLAGLGVQDSIWAFRNKHSSPQPNATIRDNLVRLCRQEPVDFVILKASFPEWQDAEWIDPADQTTWRLYGCAQLLAKLEDADHDGR